MRSVAADVGVDRCSIGRADSLFTSITTVQSIYAKENHLGVGPEISLDSRAGSFTERQNNDVTILVLSRRGHTKRLPESYPVNHSISKN